METAVPACFGVLGLAALAWAVRGLIRQWRFERWRNAPAPDRSAVIMKFPEDNA